mmetsp:Transcript_21636/g.48892  ORF Transcript_21636/g.48892 Transcript_21636/m.48892 type:complete len:392 (-) Transcript_21636:504-1679(-)
MDADLTMRMLASMACRALVWVSRRDTSLHIAVKRSWTCSIKATLSSLRNSKVAADGVSFCRRAIMLARLTLCPVFLCLGLGKFVLDPTNPAFCPAAKAMFLTAPTPWRSSRSMMALGSSSSLMWPTRWLSSAPNPATPELKALRTPLFGVCSSVILSCMPTSCGSPSVSPSSRSIARYWDIHSHGGAEGGAVRIASKRTRRLLHSDNTTPICASNTIARQVSEKRRVEMESCSCTASSTSISAATKNCRSDRLRLATSNTAKKCPPARHRCSEVLCGAEASAGMLTLMRLVSREGSTAMDFIGFPNILTRAYTIPATITASSSGPNKNRRMEGSFPLTPTHRVMLEQTTNRQVGSSPSILRSVARRRWCRSRMPPSSEITPSLITSITIPR